MGPLRPHTRACSVRAGSSFGADTHDSCLFARPGNTHASWRISLCSQRAAPNTEMQPSHLAVESCGLRPILLPESSMLYGLTQLQRERFDEEGFLIVENALSLDQLNLLLDVVDHL